MGLDGVEFVFAIEDAFGITIPNQDAEQFATPRHIADYLKVRLQSEEAPGPQRKCSRLQIEEIVRRLMQEEIGIKVFNWDDQFHEDLGVD